MHQKHAIIHCTKLFGYQMTEVHSNVIGVDKNYYYCLSKRRLSYLVRSGIHQDKVLDHHMSSQYNTQRFKDQYTNPTSCIGEVLSSITKIAKYHVLKVNQTPTRNNSRINDISQLSIVTIGK